MLKVIFAALALICYITGIIVTGIGSVAPLLTVFFTGVALLVAAIVFTVLFVFKETELPA